MDKIAKELTQHHLRIKKIENYLKIDDKDNNSVVNKIIEILRNEVIELQEKRKKETENHIIAGQIMECNRLVNIINEEFP